MLTPLFLVAGTFFPLEPAAATGRRCSAKFNPLHHCVELVRDAAFGVLGWVDLLRVGALVVFGLAVWRLAIFAMTRKLID